LSGAQAGATDLALILSVATGEQRHEAFALFCISSSNTMTYPSTASETNSLSVSSTFRRLAVASVILLLATMAPRMAAAQQDATPADTAPRWTKTFVQQTETLLESGNADMQARGMQLIVEFGKRSADTFNFNELRPQLYDILLNQDNTDNLRILALSALHATGSSPSTQVLAESVQEERSPRVRRFMLLTLQVKQ
jgi:hypothetical protein